MYPVRVQDTYFKTFIYRKYRTVLVIESVLVVKFFMKLNNNHNEQFPIHSFY